MAGFWGRFQPQETAMNNSTLKAKLVAFGLAFVAAGLFAADLTGSPDRVIEIAAPLPPPATRGYAVATPRECEADLGITTDCSY